MDHTFRYRRVLVRRILEGLGLAALALPVAHVAGCGGKVVVDNVVGGGGSPGEGGGGAGGGGVVPCDPTSVGSTNATGGDPVQQITSCFGWGAGSCPHKEVAATIILPSTCGHLLSVDCGPMDPVGASCCYLVTETVQGCLGRPFTVDQRALTARADGCASGWTDGETVPVTAGLAPTDRATLADAFAADALLEHASVASFAHAALELLAVGAPADLVAAAHRAALDEVQHARLCFALAQAYRGAPMAPSPFPFNRSVQVSSDLAAVAARVARDGCVGETVAALVAAEQLSRARDPAVRRALAIIARDEARHAELAWRTVAWALETGDAGVREAVTRAFSDACAHAPAPIGTAAGLDAHGRLDARDAALAIRRALDEVVEPCALALLAS